MWEGNSVIPNTVLLVDLFQAVLRSTAFFYYRLVLMRIRLDRQVAPFKGDNGDTQEDDGKPDEHGGVQGIEAVL